MILLVVVGEIDVGFGNKSRVGLGKGNGMEFFFNNVGYREREVML